MIPNGYVAIVASEPIPGIPSHRLYGPFDSREHARSALTHAGILTAGESLGEGWTIAGVLPLRPTDTLAEERP